MTKAEQTPAADDMIPEYFFFCPMTIKVMSDPFVSKHGQNFKQNAILEWWNAGNLTSPITRQPLTPSMLIPNVILCMQIYAWQ
jgi:hypothetical protein